MFKQLSLPSKINSNPALPAAFIPFFQENFLHGLRRENSPEKECGGKRIRIKGKITGINCDRCGGKRIRIKGKITGINCDRRDA